MPGENKQTPEPEVVEAVKLEIKKLGEGYEANKTNYDELRKSVEAFQTILDENDGKFDALITEKFTKFGEDVTTRQEDIDSKFVVAKEEEDKINKRIDDVEVALKRTPKAGSAEVEDLVKLEAKAVEFMINALTVQGVTKGLKTSEVEKLEVNMDEFKAYSEAFPKFLRTDKRRYAAEPDMLKSLTVGIDPDGGYTVTPVMSNRIITRLFESDPVRQLASVESITTDAIEWLVDYDEAGWGWEAETVAGSETDTPKIFMKRIPVHVMYAKPRVSQTLLEDSAINVENWLADHISKRFLRGEGAACFW
ncbi:MAG: phage major capsid protein [Deltaproteobacteria bacterium]|nr:phage major capsid protein [Deltaproteobacteria bacterium]